MGNVQPHHVRELSQPAVSTGWDDWVFAIQGLSTNRGIGARCCEVRRTAGSGLYNCVRDPQTTATNPHAAQQPQPQTSQLRISALASHAASVAKYHVTLWTESDLLEEKPVLGNPLWTQDGRKQLDLSRLL